MATVDLTVMGAGVFGLSVAFACARRGASVRVIDPNGPGRGASGGTLGALAPHTPERWNETKAFQLESLLGAPAFWAAVEELSGQSTGYRRTGRLQPIARPRALDLALAREGQARDLWRGCAHWQVVPAEAAGPWAPKSPTGRLVHDTLSARIDPRRACAGLAAACEALGVDLVVEAPARGKVLWATGWRGLRALSDTLGCDMGGGVKGQALLLEHDAPHDAPQVFAGGLYIVAHDNGTVAVGSTSERTFRDPRGTDAQLDELHRRAVALMPQLADAPVLERWAGVRPRAITGTLLLGPFPGRKGHFIANGGFKTGFGMAPGVAEVMAALILDGQDLIPEPFGTETALSRASGHASG